MNEPDILVDTSYWIEALRAKGNVSKKKIFNEVLLSGRLAWAPPIKLELWNGTNNSREIKVLEEFDLGIRSYEVTDEVWSYSLKVGSFLRRKGLTIPAIDILIASIASHYKLELLHSDKHFDQMIKLIKGSRK